MDSAAAPTPGGPAPGLTKYQRGVSLTFQVFTAAMLLALLVVLIVIVVAFHRGTHKPSGAGCVINAQCRSGVCLGGGILNLAPAVCQ